MQVAKMEGRKRELSGRHANDRLRREGLLPAVIYGHKEDPEHVAVPLRDIAFALEHQAHVVELTVDGQASTYLLKDVQYDHLYRTPIHVDLLRVDPNERVSVKVALQFVGTPKGLTADAEMLTSITDLEVECPALQIPESIRVNIASLGHNESLLVKQLTLPDGMKALEDEDAVVCLIRTKRAHAEPTEAEAEGEGSAEPEVISKGKAEDEAGE